MRNKLSHRGETLSNLVRLSERRNNEWNRQGISIWDFNRSFAGE